MAIAYFTIPETGKIIYNGDTVILSEYPDTIAVVAYGWYRYEENAMNGWHFILLPSKSIIPAANVNLSLLTVVPNSSDDCRHPVPVNPVPRGMESRTFITLDSIAQRDKLVSPFMPNGRIVRVNNRGDGKPGYYEWNVMTQEWDEWDLADSGSSDYEERISALEYQVDIWKEAERLENQMAGLPEYTYDELNQMLGARLRGEEINI